MNETIFSAGVLILSLSGPLSYLLVYVKGPPEKMEGSNYDSHHRLEKYRAIGMSIPMIVGALLASYGLLFAA